MSALASSDREALVQLAHDLRVTHQVVIVYNRGRAKHHLRDWNRGKGDE